MANLYDMITTETFDGNDITIGWTKVYTCESATPSNWWQHTQFETLAATAISIKIKAPDNSVEVTAKPDSASVSQLNNIKCFAGANDQTEWIGNGLQYMSTHSCGRYTLSQCIYYAHGQYNSMHLNNNVSPPRKVPGVICRWNIPVVGPDMEIYFGYDINTCVNGGVQELILDHKNATVSMFSSNIKSTGLENENNPSANTYSTIGNLNPNDFINGNNKYEFYLINEGVSGGLTGGPTDYLKWEQSEWLTQGFNTLSYAPGFTLISFNPTEITSRNDATFYGLGLSGASQCYLDATSYASNWWNCVGATFFWRGIAGYNEASSVSQSLYACRFRTQNPTTNPTITPTKPPTNAPSLAPSFTPISPPTNAPSTAPTLNPSLSPSLNPSISPSLNPSLNPTLAPSLNPSLTPSLNPTLSPSIAPTSPPTNAPSTAPTLNPSTAPTLNPSHSPSMAPSLAPTHSPTLAPTISPSIAPTNPPTLAPTISPSLAPSVAPSLAPSIAPSIVPSLAPSLNPSLAPSIAPSVAPSLAPSIAPSLAPSAAPTPTCHYASFKKQMIKSEILQRNDILYGGESLVSVNCRFLLFMKANGNLILKGLLGRFHDPFAKDQYGRYTNENIPMTFYNGWQTDTHIKNLSGEAVPKLVLENNGLAVYEEKFKGIPAIPAVLLWNTQTDSQSELIDNNKNELILILTDEACLELYIYGSTTNPIWSVCAQLTNDDTITSTSIIETLIDETGNTDPTFDNTHDGLLNENEKHNVSTLWIVIILLIVSVILIILGIMVRRYYSYQSSVKTFAFNSAVISTDHKQNIQTTTEGGFPDTYNDVDFSVHEGDADHETEKALELWSMEANEKENNVTEFTV